MNYRILINLMMRALIDQNEIYVIFEKKYGYYMAVKGSVFIDNSSSIKNKIIVRCCLKFPDESFEIVRATVVHWKDRYTYNPSQSRLRDMIDNSKNHNNILVDFNYSEDEVMKKEKYT